MVSAGFKLLTPFWGQVWVNLRNSRTYIWEESQKKKATPSLDAVTPIQSHFYPLSKVYVFLVSKPLPRFYGNSESLLLTTANNLSK